MVRSKKDLIEIILCSLIIPEILFIAQEIGQIDIAEDVFGHLGLLIVLALLGFGLLMIRSKVQPAGLRIVLQILLFPALMLSILGLIVVLASYFFNRSSSSDVTVSAGRTSAGTYSGGYAGGYASSIPLTAPETAAIAAAVRLRNAWKNANVRKTLTVHRNRSMMRAGGIPIMPQAGLSRMPPRRSISCTWQWGIC